MKNGGGGGEEGGGGIGMGSRGGDWKKGDRIEEKYRVSQ